MYLSIVHQLFNIDYLPGSYSKNTREMKIKHQEGILGNMLWDLITSLREDLSTVLSDLSDDQKKNICERFDRRDDIEKCNKYIEDLKNMNKDVIWGGTDEAIISIMLNIEIKIHTNDSVSTIEPDFRD